MLKEAQKEERETNSTVATSNSDHNRKKKNDAIYSV